MDRQRNVFMTDQLQLLELTAEIVAAHLTNNKVAVGDVASVVQRVHATLAALNAPAVQAEPDRKVPVVSARASVKPDYIVCMECGKKQKTLKRHLQTAHGLTPAQYREDYGLPASYPMTAPAYSEQRQAMARSIGLGRKRAEPAAPEPQSPTARRPRRAKAPAEAG
jgi:predicted transcriptional regulator